MNWTDKPVHRLKSHRRRKLAKLDMNYRDSKSNGAVAWNMLPVKVLTDWHVDEHGCRARTVGNEA